MRTPKTKLAILLMVLVEYTAPAAHRAFFWASLIVTVGVSAWLARVARRALREAMPQDPEKQDLDSLPETGPPTRDRFPGKAR